MTSDPKLIKKFKAIYKCVGKAKYQKALLLSQSLTKQYPKNLEVCQTYATMLADASNYIKDKNSSVRKRKSIKLLRSLTFKLNGQPLDIKSAIRNEYFYHSGQFKKQYDLGISMVKKGDKTSYFSQGVGAAWYAHSLLKKKQIKRAKKWAHKSIIAWKKYLKIEPNYYNSYVHLALAYGIIGNNDKLEESLKKSAKLSGKSENYLEFQNIRHLIKSNVSAVSSSKRNNPNSRR